MPARRRVFVFDLDDTLFKELDFLRSAFREIARTLAPEAPETLFAEMLDARSRGENVFARLSARFGVPVADLLARYRAHVPDVALAPDVRATLETLRERGATLCLLTDGRSLTQRNKIRALGLDAFFDDANVVISEEFGSEKPCARNCEFFAEKFPGADFCCVGDNPAKDFAAPNALGWRTVCLLDDGGNVRPQDFAAVPAAFLPQRKIKT
ncbi:MAG: HAD family hydrolase, partial [Candidatus Spyradosoma sp.]